MRLVFLILATYVTCFTWAYPPSRTSSDPDAILLSQVDSLVLKRNEYTTGRRSRGVPQLKCVGGPCSGNEPSVVHCVQAGIDYNTGDPNWKCTAAHMNSGLRLGATDVICEGFSNPNDPYILRGSCGLEYTIEGSPSGDNTYYGGGYSSSRYYSSRTSSGGGGGWSWITYLLLIWLAMFIYRTCVSPNGTRGLGYATGAADGGGGGGGGGIAGGGGGYGYGGARNPFNYWNLGQDPNNCAPGAAAAAAPGGGMGFWQGLGLGGLAGYMFGGGNRYGAGYNNYGMPQFGGGAYGAPRPAYFGGGGGGGFGGGGGGGGGGGPATGYGTTRRR